MTNHLPALLAISLLAMACSTTSPSTDSSSSADVATTDSQTTDAGADSQGADSANQDATTTPPDTDDAASTACTGLPPIDCAESCGSDALCAVDCSDGVWSCPAGCVEASTCPPDTCWGAPLPGEACEEGEWVCKPQDFVYEDCEPLACVECDGFDGPVSKSGCTCACTNGEVRCQKDVPTCDGDAPLCAPSCGGDSFFGPAVCTDGKWTCEEGIPTTDCPPGSCFGEKYPGEVCTDDGWSCQPSDEAYGVCHDVMCLTCDGFSGPTTVDGCACACEAGVVECQKVEEQGCGATSASTLAGVSIAITATDCTFTLAEAAAGITIPYEVVVAGADTSVIPLPQDAGECGQPGPSGLILFERLAGSEQQYCICDTGLCQGPDMTPVSLDDGTWPGAFEWDGKNWDGPSDTGNDKGPAFPPGTYTLTVNAKGQAVAPDDGTSPFEVRATAQIHLIP